MLRDVCLPEVAPVKVGVGLGAALEQAGVRAKVFKDVASVRENITMLEKETRHQISLGVTFRVTYFHSARVLAKTIL